MPLAGFLGRPGCLAIPSTVRLPSQDARNSDTIRLSDHSPRRGLGRRINMDDAEPQPTGDYSVKLRSETPLGGKLRDFLMRLPSEVPCPARGGGVRRSDCRNVVISTS